MKKQDCNTVIRIKTYDEIIRTQKHAEPARAFTVKTAKPAGKDIKIKQIQETKRFHLSKKFIVLSAAILVVVISVPVFFATASNSNEVAGYKTVSTPAAATPKTVVSASSAAPPPAATGGQLTSELTEETTVATPPPAPSPAASSLAAPAVLPTALPMALASATPLSEDSAYEQLSPGVTDPFVAMVQQRLMDLFYVDQDEPTTLYGPVTKQAVTAFQKLNNLSQTGTADVQTQSVLFSPAANPYIVKPGDSSPDVQTIQERLAELGYKVEISGTYAEDTQKAIQTFQTLNSLDPDGNVGNETRQALYSSKARNAGAEPLPGKDTEIAKPLAPADPNKVEALINAAMAELGKSYVLGGKGPNIFDCSGLVYYALKASGNGIGYMTSYDWADAGEYQRVGSMKELQRGDVVCESGHVGIYLGDGRVVNASSSNGNVIVSQDIFTSAYWKDHFICGRRPF